MVNININVDINNVKIQETPQLETGELNVTNLTFSFSEEYSNLTKYCIFSKDSLKYKVTIENNTCEIPKDLFNTVGELIIGVYAENDDNTLRYSPIPIKLKIVKGSYNGTEEPEILSFPVVIPENAHPFFGEIVGFDSNKQYYAFTVDTEGFGNVQDFVKLDNESIINFVKGFDCSGVRDFSNMFENSDIEELPKFNTSNAVNMDSMFSGCTKLKKVPFFDTSNVENMYSMFSACEMLEDVPQFDTSSVTDMSHMFMACSSLKEIPPFNTSNVTDMREAFAGCMTIQSVPLFDTSNVEDASYMFTNCPALVDVPQFNMSSATTMRDMFRDTPFLSDESLNNILGMCVSAVNINGRIYVKSLQELGLDTEKDYSQFSNYDAFIEAGWRVRS